MATLTFFVKRYVLRHWPVILLAFSTSGVVTVLNVASLGVFTAIPQLILEWFAPSQSLVQRTEGGGSSSFFGLDISGILVYIRAKASLLATEYGIVTSIIFISTIYVFLVIVSRLFQLSSDYALLKGRVKTTRAAIKDMFYHISNLSMDFFHRRQVGDLSARITGDSNALASALFEAANIIVTAIPLFIFYWLLLFGLNWKLTTAAILIFGIKALVADYFARKIRTAIIAGTKISGKTASKLVEILSNIHVVKVFGAEEMEHSHFSAMVDSQSRYLIRQVFNTQLLNTVQTILQSLASVGVATYGVVMLLDGLIDPVALLVFFFAANRTQEPTRKILNFILTVHKARGVSVRVFDILREKTSVPDGSETAEAFQSDIKFEAVSFSYRPDSPALKNIDLTLKKGEVLAVVGPSGSGKSTLLQLLLRFHDPDSGEIQLDGKDIRSFSQHSYRSLFGTVTQDPILFNASIRDNIAYAAKLEEVTDESVLSAAQVAHVDEFAEQWEEGYDTMVGDRGVRLSGGQKQRITLARAILRNPDILILDEATSSLDSQSERFIQDAIAKFLNNRTAVIVAHRLSTIRHAHKIVVLSGGSIVEAGTHDELLALKGAYSGMFISQIESEEQTEPNMGVLHPRD